MLYLRHAEKRYSNGGCEKYSLDPEITERGAEKTKRAALVLVRRFGIPSKIVASPYLRTRQTAEIIRDIIEQSTGVTVELSCDPEIGEYLGHHKGKDMLSCLREETLMNRPIAPEDWGEYGRRIRKHIRNAKSDAWYITHGLVITSNAFFRGVNIPYPEELTGIHVTDTLVSRVCNRETIIA